MPFQTNKDLPPRVKSAYPGAAAQNAFRKAFNSAIDGTCADADDSEACAFGVANVAAKNVSKAAIQKILEAYTGDDLELDGELLEELEKGQADQDANNKKYQARQTLQAALKSGKVTAGPCKKAGDDCSGKIQGHHPNYDKPLQVDWLCDHHHRGLRVAAAKAKHDPAEDAARAAGGRSPCPRGQHRDEKTGKCRPATAAEMREAKKEVGELVPFVIEVPIAKFDGDRRLVYGVVYEPNIPDAHSDFMTAADIEKSAHGFLTRYALERGELGTDHRHKEARDGISIVESFLAPVAFELGDQLVTKGTWVMAAKVHDDGLWKAVNDGRFRGWSFEGWGRRIAA